MAKQQVNKIHVLIKYIWFCNKNAKNNILKSLIMMDKYNLRYILVWFARNKIKHEKFFAR